jgi:hypothetical protein
MNEKVGVLAFSFAQTQEEIDKKRANPCNRNIAVMLSCLASKKDIHFSIVAQWEIMLNNVLEPRVEPVLVVEKHRKEGEYLDSEEIIAQWLQNFKCRALLKKAGFEIIPLKKFLSWKTRKIGFCKDSLQWWTRGPIRLVLYTILQVLFGRRGR